MLTLVKLEVPRSKFDGATFKNHLFIGSAPFRLFSKYQIYFTLFRKIMGKSTENVLIPAWLFRTQDNNILQNQYLLKVVKVAS